MKNFCLSFFPIAFILLALSSFGQDPDEQDQMYFSQLEQERSAKNEQFMNAEISPLKQSDIESFNSLRYFTPDVNYKVAAQVNVLAEQQPVQFSTTNGGKMELMKYATVTFMLNNKQYTLSAFIENKLPEFQDAPGQLFIPFKDRTNGNETNANGRYMIITMPQEGNAVELDFNRSFNPYSAYNADYNSVIPTDGNTLPIVVMSGERKYEDR